MSIDSSFGTPADFENPSGKSPETLEQEIDEQRSSIGHLVDALEKKISPGQLIDQALAYAKGNGGEFLGNLGTTVKANPVPVVLTSVGMLWLMMGSRTPSPGPSMLDQVGDSLSNAKDRVQETAIRMKEKAGHLAENIGERLPSSPGHEAGRILQEKSLGLRSSAHTLLNEQPLVVAAMGIALGALIGAALPTSDREKQLIGQARDRLATMPSEPVDRQNASTGKHDFTRDTDLLAETADTPTTRSGPSPGLSPGVS
ncbi:DUF3618 domain-containing protein [Pseudomonas sp. NPDC089734]|uniref:DUF3618 domain-containing protein n=1 Tax=Pseudomonas sp. NPDC089734 TaxID=3364469 RepID=UPI00380696AA